MNKVCSVCKIKKELNYFPKSRVGSFGCEGRCRECDNKRRQKFYAEVESKKITKETRSLINHKRYVDNINWYKTRKSESIKTKARAIANRAIKNGLIKLKYFCEECGEINKRIEKHHNDYSKPLEVIFLCSKCHHKRHVKK